MSNQLARIEHDAPNAPVAQLSAVQPAGLTLSPDKRELLKRTICKGATDDELELALAIAGRMGLDPFARQIAFIKRWDSRERREVMTAQPTIDGARLLAQRSQHYGGQLGPWWCGRDGQWVDVWLSDDLPVAARCGVINTQFAEPLYAVAKFSSYAAKNKEGRLTPTWAQMPDLMIAKCAEMLALRRAFPAEFSDFGGVDYGDAADVSQMVTDAAQYIEADGIVADAATGEIVQHDEHKTQPTQADAIKRLHATASAKQLSHEDLHYLALGAFETDSLTDLDVPRLAQLTTWVETLPRERLAAGIAKGRVVANPPADEPAAETPQNAPDAPDDADVGSPIDEFMEALSGATTAAEFEAISRHMTDGGVWSPELAALQVEKRRELGMPAPKPMRGTRTMNDIVGDAPVFDGEPGEDRFTN